MRTIMSSVRVVVILLVWVAAACTPTPVTPTPPTPPTNTPTDTPPAPTDTPTDTPKPPTDTPEPTATDTPPPSDVDLATEFSVFYALPETSPDPGIAYLLTPRRESPGITAEELVANPGALQDQVLGRLRIVRQSTLQLQLPPGDYMITLAPDGEALLFTGAAGEVAVPAVIRALPIPLTDRPVAMISSVQMCLAWDLLQICGLVSTPLPGPLIEQLNAAVEDLEVNPDSLALDRAIPDVEGDNVLDPCLAELNKDEPDYTQCPASVLAAPAREALPPPPSFPDAISTGVLVVLQDLELPDDVFKEPDTNDPVGLLPAGNYVMYDIVLPEDEVIDTYDEQQITVSRVGLSPVAGAEPEFYLLAIRGAPLQGTPPEGPQAVISNLWIEGWDGIWSCYVRSWQCPYYPP
jgi:hypothetical protein